MSQGFVLSGADTALRTPALYGSNSGGSSPRITGSETREFYASSSSYVNDSHVWYFTPPVKTVLNGVTFVALTVVFILAQLGVFRYPYDETAALYTNVMTPAVGSVSITSTLAIVFGYLELSSVIFFWMQGLSPRDFNASVEESFMANFIFLPVVYLHEVALIVCYTNHQLLAALILSSLGFLVTGLLYWLRPLHHTVTSMLESKTHRSSRRTTVFTYAAFQVGFKAFLIFLEFQFLDLVFAYIKEVQALDAVTAERLGAILTAVLALMTLVFSVVLQVDGVLGLFFASQLFQVAVQQKESHFATAWPVSLSLSIVVAVFSLLACGFAYTRYQNENGTPDGFPTVIHGVGRNKSDGEARKLF